MELGEKISNAGHQLGNHTYSHKPMIFKSSSYTKEEIHIEPDTSYYFQRKLTT